MTANLRVVGVFLLSIAVAAAFSPSLQAAPRGGGGRGGGGSHGGGSGGGPHISGGGANLGGGHHSSGNPSGSHRSGPNISGGHGRGVGGGGGGGGSGNPIISGGTRNTLNLNIPNRANLGIDHPLSPNHGSHGMPHNPANTVRSNTWDHNNWSQYHHGDWNHNQVWWNNHGHNWVGWWQVGIGWPWYGVGWWPRYYGYSDYAYPYSGDTYIEYNYAPEAVPYTAAYPPDDAAAAAPPAEGDMMDFYPQALAAFQDGDYRNAVRLAGHASIDDPRNPGVHLLLSLGLFAVGEYRGAAMEAHAVASLGKMPDWAKVFEIYGKAEPYTEQLRELEKFARENPQSPEGRFLLGFQYLMAGHRESAQNELLQALKLTPKDRLAAQLLKEAGGTVPEDIARQLAPATPPPPPAIESNEMN